MKWLLLVLLGGVLIYLLLQYVRKGGRRRAAAAAAPIQDLANLSVVEARVGDQISVVGLGDDFEDLDFAVDRRHRYESGGDRWYELGGRYRGRQVYVEWYRDDELEVSVINQPCDLHLADLGVTEDDLARMDAEQVRSAGFQYDGSRWGYESSEETGFFEDDSGEGEGFYAWEFREQNGTRLIFIEKWAGEPFEVGIAHLVPPQNVRVFRP